MVLAVLTSLAQRISLTSTATRFAIAFAIFLLAGRVYSATPSLRVRRILHGKTTVISGGISALSVAYVSLADVSVGQLKSSTGSLVHLRNKVLKSSFSCTIQQRQRSCSFFTCFSKTPATSASIAKDATVQVSRRHP